MRVVFPHELRSSSSASSGTVHRGHTFPRRTALSVRASCSWRRHEIDSVRDPSASLGTLGSHPAANDGIGRSEPTPYVNRARKPPTYIVVPVYGFAKATAFWV